MANTGRPQDVWKASAAGGGPGRPGKRSPGGARRWFTAALIVVALGGAIAGLLVYLWPDPPPVVLAVPVTAYEHADWPPDPWAEGDARGLVERSGGDTAQTFQAQEKQAIVRELNRVADTPGRRPVVAYISALGVSEGGKVSLIPGGGRPDDPATWLPLDEVLSPLRRATAPRLLVLDVRPATDSRAVLTGEDVNEALDAALERLEKAGDLPFFVLTANTPADGANLLRPLKRSAFGLALTQAAGGEADGWNPERKRDGRVSVKELAAHTRELTHFASVTAGLPSQLPRLHGAGADFDLFRVARTGPAALPTPADPEPYPDYLTAAWKDRDAWTADRLHLRAPRILRHLTLTATRAERRWLAGGEPAAIKATFDAQANRLREVRPTLVPITQPVGSVARARKKPGVNPTAAREALQTVFNRVVELPSPERDMALAAAMKLVWDKPLDAEPFDSVAMAVFAFARNLERPTAEQMKQLAALVGGFRPHPPRHAELATLALIGGFTAEQAERWPPLAIPTLLEVAALAEEAAASDGRCLPWVKGELAKADELRRKAVRDLCDPKSPNKVRMTAVAELEAVRKDYEGVRAAAGALTDARYEYEETRAVLADMAVAFPVESLPIPEVAAKTWADLVEDFLRVRKALTPPTEPALPDSGELGRLAQSLRANREQLRAMLRVPDTANVRQYEALLRWPNWPHADRTKLLTRLADAERTAVRKVLDGWPKDPPGREAVAAPKGPTRGPADALRSLGRWLVLLRAADAAGVNDLAAEMARAGAEPTAVAALARKVRQAVRRAFPAEYAAADPTRQAAIGWAIDPDDAPAFPQPGAQGTPNPELPEHRTAEAEFHDWLAGRRYKLDADLFGASPLKGPQDAATGYRDVARLYTEAFR